MGANEDVARHFGPSGYRPANQEVEDLIRRASDSEHGTSFLLEGAQDSVAATFQVHAFLVDAARRRLQDGRLQEGDASL